MATLLHVGTIQDPDKPPGWQTSTVINEPQHLTFKWSTTDPNVSARWKVKVPGSPGPQQIASGNIQSVPKAPGQEGQFTIDFKTFAPPSPANSPTVYDVTVSTYPATAVANGPVSTSSPVKVKYQKPTQPPVVFDADLGFTWRTIKIALTRLDATTNDDPNSNDEPYLLMVRFRVRITVSAAGVAAPVPGTLQVGVVGPGGHKNLGHSGDDWFKPGQNYDISSANLVVAESVPTGQPGWLVGAVIVFFDEDSWTASTVAQVRDLAVSAVSNNIGTLALNVDSSTITAAVVNSIVGKLGSSLNLLNLGVVKFLSGLLELADPDDYGGVNFVAAATVAGGRVVMVSGPPPTTPAGFLSTAVEVTTPASFALGFPAGDLAEVTWRARYTGSCILRGMLTAGLKN